MSGFTAVLPVRRWDRSKSRLALPVLERVNLSRAFSLDVLEALAGSAVVARVVVVTDERSLSAAACDSVVVWHDGSMSGDGLGGAVEAGLDWASTHHPSAPLVVVPADLPSLTTATLDEALAEMLQHDRAFVPDAAGTGTTLLTGIEPSRVRPAYGPGSAAAHRDNGHVPCPAVDPRARCDVDTVTDLRLALVLGVGRRTRAAWSASAHGFGDPAVQNDVERRISTGR